MCNGISCALGVAVVAAALDAIVVHDERGRIIEFNPTAERTFGYRRGEAVGRDLSRADHPRFRGQNAATQKCVALDLDVADRGECLLDAPKVRQMLDQLLSNAIKFTPEGGWVSVRICPEDGDSVIIAVSDTGIGIAATDLPRLFKPFSQFDGTLSRTYGGTGLGLALVKRMAEEHGGTVTAESEPGKGSTFTLRLVFRPIETG